MPRHLLPLGVAALLAAAFLAVFLAPVYVGGQAVPIRGTASTQSGEWNIRHIGVQLHIANTAARSALAVRCVNTGGTAFEACGGTISSVDTVNTIGHLSSVVHIAVSGAGTPTSSLPVRCVNTAGTAFEACGGAGAAADSVNVFHQSTVRHVSSVTHVTGGVSILARDGTYAGLVGTSLLTATAAAQSGPWTIQALHQAVVSHVSSVLHVSGNLSQVAGVTLPLGGGLPVGHISSVVHLTGSVRLMGSTPNNQLVVVTHSGALTVTCQTAAGVAESCAGSGGASDSVNVFHQSTIRHVSALTHVVIVDWQRWAHMQASQSGAWTVSAAHISNMPSVAQGGSWTIQAAHQGGEWNLRHVTSVTHVFGTVSLVSRAGTYASFTSTSLDVNVTTATLAVTQSGTWTVQPGNSANTTPWLANVFHVSSQVHVIGRVILQNVAGTAVSVTSTSLDTNITNATLAVTQSGTWTVQPGNTPNTAAWLANIGHVSSVLHIQVAGAGIPGASLSVRCVNTGGTAFADCGGAGGSSDAVNVFHQSTIRHVSSVQHMALMSVAGTPLGLGAGLPIGHLTSVVHIAVSGLGTPTQAISVRCVNTGATAFVDCGGAGGSGDAVNVFHQSTVRHISSVTHVAGMLQLTNRAASAVVSLTGTSLDVNCTGGCGTPTQAQTYIASANSTAAAASKDYLTLFNASGSGKVLKVVSATVRMGNTAAVTGAGAIFVISRVSTAGTTCTAQTIRLIDSANAAVPAQVTANTNCTTDPTVSYDYTTCSVDLEETRPSVTNYCYKFENTGGQPLTLREGQGIMLKTTAVVPVGLATVTIEFTM